MPSYDSIHPDIISNEERYILLQLSKKASKSASGIRFGQHLTSGFGSSLEFSDHKVYAPGDDIKRLDWKSYARNDRYSVRRYHEEVNTHFEVVLDHSASMNYYGHKSRKLSYSKWDCARTLASILARNSVKQGENFGLTLSPSIQSSIPSRSGDAQIYNIEKTFAKTESIGKSSLSLALKHLQGHIKNNSQIILISDFLDYDEVLIKTLTEFSAKNHKMTCIQILHHDEIHFPFTGKYLFLDPSGEGERQSENQAEDLRKHYLKAFEKAQNKLHEQLKKLNIPFFTHKTDTSLFSSIQHLMMPQEF